MSAPSFVCPRCGATTYHPYDVQEGYCIFCLDWTAVPPRVWTGIQMGEPPPIFIDTDTVVGDLDSLDSVDSVPLTAEQRDWRNRRSTRRSIRRSRKGGVRSGVPHHWWGRWTISFADLPPVMATRFRKSDAELLAAELNAAEPNPADRQYRAVKRPPRPSGP